MRSARVVASQFTRMHGYFCRLVRKHSGLVPLDRMAAMRWVPTIVAARVLVWKLWTRTFLAQHTHWTVIIDGDF